MKTDDAVWALFSSDRLDLTDIDIQPDPQVKAILKLLQSNGGYIYAFDYKTSAKRRRIINRGHYLLAMPEEISDELKR